MEKVTTMAQAQKRTFLGGVLIALISLLLGGSLVVAQDNDETPTDETEPTTGESYPAHIYQGSCDDLGEMVFALADVRIVESDAGAGTPVAEGETLAGLGSAIPVLQGITQLDASLDDLLAEGHAVGIRAGDDNQGDVLACGDIGGAVVDDELMSGLQEVDGSGHAGVVIFQRSNEGETTNVAVYLGQYATTVEDQESAEEGDDS